MILKINKSGNLLGQVEVIDGTVRFLGYHDKGLEKFIGEALHKGIIQLVDIYDEKTQTNTILQGPIAQSDPHFSLALKKFLEVAGYEVVEKHQKIEEEIKKLLGNFPNDNPDRVDIMSRLPEMTYLEQTAILEGLKNLDSQE